MMNVSYKSLAAALVGSIERNTLYVESRIIIISVIAIVCFPLYYVVWHYIFPQPYENITLRLVGSVLFVPLLFVRSWPQWLRKFVPVYWYLATLYGLPFFFTFMLLKNEASIVWLMSALVAVFFMTLLHNVYNLIIQFVLGTGIAWLVFSLTTNQIHAHEKYWDYLPIYLFAMVGGILLNISAELVKQERLRAMLAAVSNIAHELRTPLLGIKSGSSGLLLHLPILLEAYRLAKDARLAVKPLRTAYLNSMQEVLERIENEADQSSIIINMLLMNTRVDGSKEKELAACSICACVEKALQRYPFASEKDKLLVAWNNDGDDFKFRGVELLMQHILFNLIKNALYHMTKAGKGGIFIRLKKTPTRNILIFKDTGTGIPPEVLPHIFTRFYTWSADRDLSTGTGIGLAFCRSVMESFGGAIGCTSRLGEYTEFTLTFPLLEEKKL